MAITPRSDDKNRDAELKRMNKEAKKEAADKEASEKGKGKK